MQSGPQKNTWAMKKTLVDIGDDILPNDIGYYNQPL